MASSTYQQQPFPAVPPSMSAGEHEMRDYHAPQDAPRPTINQTPDFKPYLGLRARLSQIWINRWTILLLLVLVRLLFAIASTDSSLVSARREALSACTSVEKIGSSMASMPHYMSQGVNEMTASGIDKAVGGLMKMLEMSVTGVEEIVLFVIHMMTSTYLCLITLAVSGSLHAAVELGTEINKKLNETIDEVTGDIGNSVKSVTEGINSIMDKINFNLPGFKKPEINLDSSISKLKALELPSEMQEGLVKLNQSIPTFDQVQNFTDNLIRTPFEEVKKLIKAMDKFEFNRTLLPVPQKEQLNFCSEGNSINEFFDDLIEMAYNARKIALGVLIVAAILVCLPMAWMEVRRYRKTQARVALLAEGHDGMDVVYLASRPTSSSIGLWFGRRFGSQRRQAIMRWAFAYATSVPMMFLLALGIAGLFSCLCQYILLRAIEDKTPELTKQVGDFAGKVVSSLNNASMSWSQGVNGAVGKLDDTINDDMLSWVNGTTTAVNNTLNGFVDEMSKTLNETFGGTPLHDPIKEVLNCLIGLKIAGIQKGLTWVQDNAHISFPGVANNTFSLGALAAESDSGSAAELLADPSGKAKDEITEAVTYVIDKMMSGIQQEALISTVIILIWVFITLGGYIYASTQLFRRDPYESNRAYTIDPAIDYEPKPADAGAYDPAAPPSYVANDYNVNKAAPYTLGHRPFPTFDADPESEKVGSVGAHAITSSSRPGHLRASSHGDLADPSPAEDRANPFSDNHFPREK
ncbi:plasma membrane fusion protein PRM1-like protein [Parastagonospora nodorum]|uniref:Plasma membrane fusion protein PRM1 n=1 Tax=Phaeosphaeria nodorum (strain SN15 / ATCC MYA-4574 / FGSC 10173) TaxID=321614 RepID=A0A7U2EVK1_PHANO|nr:plasma membrane fusion protein PRM1-like protein [Parastagonospora nodorum]QRC93895.1 plasma membrane fusion protein PRM1-like protein [Parastagonospora nodorum SN15]KAH3922575.1 plasma membrane fusion protein PRM1-like protein [Parastagonospora nodorum]KAH3942203.1 plasma membrane fusion protein PRM1-like protein [Parastagonospora nodorum]KAH3961309.1 plasma membrane fusion protein PRM1-like protein [Parastagonospora nodorum]